MRSVIFHHSASSPFTLIILACLLLFGACDRDNPQDNAPAKISTPGATQVSIQSRTPKPPKNPLRTSRNPIANAERKPRGSQKGPVIIVTGKITLPTGRPAPDAGVELVDYSGDTWEKRWTVIGESKSAADGSYRISGPLNDSLYIRATHPEAAIMLLPVQRERELADGYIPGSQNQLFRRDIALTAGSSISGRVVSDADDTPLSGTLVAARLHSETNIVLNDIRSTVTAADGSFTLRNLTPGINTIAARAAGYQDAQTTISAPGAAVTIRVKSGGNTAAGTVTEKSTGATVAGAQVAAIMQNSGFPVLDSPRVLTNSAGAFRLTHLQSGSYALDARKGALRKFPEKNGTQYIRLWDDQTSEGINIQLYGGHTLYGRITEKNTTAPIEGAKVVTGWPGSPDSTSTSTVADGTYRLTNIFPNNGYFQIQVTKTGFIMDAGWNGMGVYFRGESLEIEKNIEMIRAVPISGTVRLPNGEPAVPAAVFPRIASQGKASPPAPVDSSGRYTVDVIPHVDLVVSATAPGYAATFSAPVNSGESGKSDVDIVLQRGTTITGRVEDLTGNAIPDARVRYSVLGRVGQVEYGNDTISGTSDADGAFRLENVPRMLATVKPEKSGFVSADTVPVSLVPDEATTDILLKMAPACFLAGKVSDTNGKPVKDCTVIARTSISNQAMIESVLTSEQGRYRMAKLPSGTVDIEVYSNGTTKVFRAVETCTDSADFQIEAVPVMTFTGKVIDWKTRTAPAKWEVSTESNVKIERPTDKPGTFIVRDLPANTCYKFVITGEGYEPLHTGNICMPDASPLASLEMPAGADPLEREFVLGPAASLRGRIVHVEGGKSSAVPGVTVTIPAYADSEKKLTRITDADGVFLFEKLSGAESRELQINPKPPFVPTTQKADIAPGVETDLGDIAVRYGTTLKGRVVRIPGEKGIADVLLQVGRGDVKQTGKSGSDGAFEFTGLTPGSTEIQMPEMPSKAGVQIDIKEVEVQEVTIRLGSATMRGKVTKAGQAIQAQVGVMSLGSKTIMSTKTEPDGTYELKNLLPGPQIAMINLPRSRDERVVKSIVIPETGELIKNFTYAGAALSGHVADMEGKPVASAKVTTYFKGEFGISDLGQTFSARSDTDGNYKLSDLPAGECTVSAEKEDVGRGTAAGIVVSESGTGKVPVIRLQRDGGTLVSLALAYPSGKPVTTADCKITGADGATLGHSSTRNSYGELTVTDIPPGSYTVEVSASSYTTAVHQVEIKAGETTRLEDVLEEAGTILISVMDKSGVAISGADCVLSPIQASSIQPTLSGKTNPIGLWQAGKVSAGEYRIDARSGSLRGSITITIQNGKEKIESVMVK